MALRPFAAPLVPPASATQAAKTTMAADRHPVAVTRAELPEPASERRDPVGGLLPGRRQVLALATRVERRLVGEALRLVVNEVGDGRAVKTLLRRSLTDSERSQELPRMADGVADLIRR
ncbi:MAG: hypothetical protein CSA65_08760 [Proteobacteria bacterium]|nr:MAG: hypothetical protein CSB49_07150 [Pseudomonadota bacterium]PIE17504.1 MAG: hypothetical protein CSA65_08760 [Pseudomonadota bacterium]